MGKPSFKKNPNTSTVETSANPSENAGIVLSAFDKSTTAEYFALISMAMDRHRLRIFNVRSGTVSNDYSTNEKEKVTCLTWGNMKDNSDLQANTVQAFKKKKSGTVPLSKAIALGLQSGAISLYSLTHGIVIKTLENAHTTPVCDFVMTKDGSRGYSIAEDNFIVEWDIEEAKEIFKWKADAKNIRKLKLSHDETKLVTAGHIITLWDLEQRTAVKKFTGHATMVKELAFSAQDDLLISSAEDDRYINVWDAQLNNTNTNNVSALTVENNVSHIDFSTTEPAVLAVTDEGLVGVWENPSLAAPQVTHTKRKMMRSMTKEPDVNIKIISTQEENKTIPILAAQFVTDKGGKSIMTARGSSIKPSFEVIKYVEDTGALIREVELARQPVTNYLIDSASIAANNLRATKKTYDESSVTVLGNTDFAVKAPTMQDSNDPEAEQTIEQKLLSLDVTDNAEQKHKKNKKKALVTPAAGSLQTVLVQALHSDDKSLLEACLQFNKRDVIETTIRRLPTEYLIPLLQDLITRFQEKPNRASVLLIWIQSILLIHTAYLMTVPNLVGKLSNFYQALDTRLSVFPKLLALRGRLDVIQNQVSVQAYSTLNDKELERAQVAETIYVEEDSDDEAEGVEEDGEDDEEDDEEEEEEEDDDAEMSEAESL
ncbi:WD40-repeat-containing domain protein [Sporodiniella umbellata]|nr:WD40-repeat-containing domain protein [Sporodiniella umbellata]